MSKRWHFLTEHAGTKIVALLLAIFAWVWVQNQEVDEARIRVQLRWKLAPGVVASQPLPSSATVEITGPRTAIRRAQTVHPHMFIDLSGEGPGSLDVHLDTYEVEAFPVTLSRRGWRPDIVSARLDEELVRNVTVLASSVGEPAAEHAVQSIKITPDVVQIAGPRALVEPLHEVHTVAIDVSGWDVSRTLPIELDLPRTVRSIEPWSGQAEVSITSLVSTRVFTEVPVVLPRNPGWLAERESANITVELKGPTAVLRAIDARDVLAVVSLPSNPDARHYNAVFNAENPPSYTILSPRPDVVHVQEAPAQVGLERP